MYLHILHSPPALAGFQDTHRQGETTMVIADFVNIPALFGAAVGATIFGWLGAYVAVKGKILLPDRMWSF